MSNPIRIQLSRKKGWKMPPNTVKVSRPSKWGNPWKVGEWSSTLQRNMSQADAVQRFRDCVQSFPWVHKDIQTLRGKNLACWCKDGPCHADVLLELANS